MKHFLLAILTLLCIKTFAQDAEKKISVKPYGFIGVDAFVDTRQSVTSRYGHVYLYPKNRDNDANLNDKNDRSSFDIGASITRLGFVISGPDAFGATTSAKIESDFAGVSGNGADRVVRLRHAFLKLQWQSASLIAGKTWHPFFVPENYPATVNFVVGAPIHPLSRAPQLRYTYKAADKLSIALIALSQGDFQNKGGESQVEMGDMPELNLQFKYGSPKDFFMAATVGVKNQLPVSVDGNGVICENTVNSFQGNLSLRYTLSAITLKAEAVYGGNLTNMVMIGGLAEKASSTADNPEFTPIRVSSYWTDIHTNGKKMKCGVFAGITSNLGTSENSAVTTPAFTRSADIGYIYAIAPRVKWISGKTTIGLELMRTTAAYGSGYDEKSKPVDTKEYTNYRLTLGCRYNF